MASGCIAMQRKLPDPVDRHVGARVRARRVLAGISQVQLGAALGVTFQQIQKYENGTNRISASKLQDIGTTLGVPAAYFFMGAPLPDVTTAGMTASKDHGDLGLLLTSPEGARLAAAFVGISSALVRRRIVDLVEALTEANDVD